MKGIGKKFLGTFKKKKETAENISDTFTENPAFDDHKVDERSDEEKRREELGPYGYYLNCAFDRTFADIKPIAIGEEEEVPAGTIPGELLYEQLRSFQSGINQMQAQLKIGHAVLEGQDVFEDYVGVCITNAGKMNFGKKITSSDLKILNNSYYPEDTLDRFQKQFNIVRAEAMHAEESRTCEVFNTVEQGDINGLESSRELDSVTLATATGKRPSNEDAHIVQELSDVVAAIPGKELLRKNLNWAREKVAKEQSGTTACMAHVANNTITVANIGDSRAFILIKSLDGAISFEPLSYDHKPSDPLEAASVVCEGGVVLGVKGNKDSIRVDNYVAVSRSLGEYKNNPGLGYVSEHVSQSPEYISTDYEVTKGEEKYLIVTCDGVFEKLAMNSLTDPENFAAVTTSDNPAETIVRLAYASGSTDNISAITVDLNKLEKPIVVGVCDGHGGQKAAQNVAESVKKTLTPQQEVVLEEDGQKTDIKAYKAANNQEDNKQIIKDTYTLVDSNFLETLDLEIDPDMSIRKLSTVINLNQQLKETLGKYCTIIGLGGRHNPYTGYYPDIDQRYCITEVAPNLHELAEQERGKLKSKTVEVPDELDVIKQKAAADLAKNKGVGLGM